MRRKSFPTGDAGDVAKWLRRRIANPLFVGSNPTVASFFSPQRKRVSSLPARRSQAGRSESEPSEAAPCDDRWENARWRGDVRRRLTAWFDQNARTMPWRSDPTPYHVWVSEVMLQQTQVATVVPYWQRWMTRMPTIRHLASADLDDVLGLWEGLGYYRRARSLHAAARQIVDEHNGVFPTRFDDVIALPGIGRYTAGAILSISGDRRFPILEGNTVRVFSRWVALADPPSTSQSQKTLWSIAEAMLPTRGGGSGRLNQAMMELGALVCRPDPACDLCPLTAKCAALAAGLQAVIPGKVTHIQYEDRQEFALVIRQPAECRGDEDGREDNPIAEASYLLHQRSRTDRWAGLWDFPRPLDDVYDAVDRASAAVAKTLARKVHAGTRLMTLKHGVTKYRITLDVHLATIDGPSSATSAKHSADQLPSNYRWVPLSQMKSLAMPVTARTIADRLQSDRQGLLL